MAERFGHTFIYLVVALFVTAGFLLFAPQPAAAATISKPANNLGLIGYWSFNEGSGSIAGDFSGNGNDATFGDSPQWINGKHGKALNFDGSNDYVITPALSSSPSTETVSVWVYPRDSGVIMSELGQPSFGGYHYIKIGLNTDNELRGNFWNCNGDLSAGIIPLGEWSHVTIIFNGSQEQIYLDGELIDTHDCSRSAPSTQYLAFAATDGQTAGGFDDTGYFDGELDDIRIYNRALSADEVKRLYQAGAVEIKSADKTNLVGYWSFNEGSGTEAGDFSGNGNDGTITGATWVDGKLGKALDFDSGGSDEVNAGQPAILNPSDKITVSAWVKPRDISCGTTNECSLVVYRHAYIFGIKNGSVFLNWRESDLDWHTEVKGSGIEVGEWSQISMTIDFSTNEGKFYIDGEQAGATFTVGDTSFVTSSSDFHIGNTTNTAEDPFNGLIDEVRIYDSALTAAEIKSLYQTKAAQMNVDTTKGGPLDVGLVGRWTFDGPDLTTTTASDTSGNGNDGTLNGDPTPIIGKVGQALDFDGSGDYLAVQNINYSSVGAIPKFTASAWVKIPDGGGDWSLLDFDRSEYFTFTAGNDGVSTGTGDLVGCHTTDSTGTIDDMGGNADVRDGTWHFVACVYDGTDKIIYVDGIEDARDVNVHGGNAIGSGTTRYGFIGTGSEASSFNGSNGGGPYEGAIDSLRYYNRALSPQEILQLYNAGK